MALGIEGCKLEIGSFFVPGKRDRLHRLCIAISVGAKQIEWQHVDTRKHCHANYVRAQRVLTATVLNWRRHDHAVPCRPACNTEAIAFKPRNRQNGASGACAVILDN